MGTARLEAFTDGVMAVIITIMAFELRPPDGGSTTYPWFVDREWAERWPAEELWMVDLRPEAT